MAEYLIPDDLSIPAFLDLRNPAVAARREIERAQSVKSAAPAFNAHNSDADEATRAFLASEAERERIEKENSIARLREKEKAKAEALLGSRYSQRRNCWINPEQDFAELATKARKPDGSRVTVAELRHYFEASGSEFAKHTLAHIDGGKLAVEADKELKRAKRRAKHKVNGMTLATVMLPGRKRKRSRK